MRDLAGKAAFVTGGASGLGLAMTRAFADAGMRVAVADIQEDALAAVREEFADSNTPVITIKTDVTDRDSMANAASEAIDAFGKIHVVCNNAGVALSKHIGDMTYQDWDWVMGVNLQGVINGITNFVPHIREHGEGGHFVNTASIAGLVGMQMLNVYNATKFAVVGISESMRLDLAKEGIGVTVLCPGVVNTNIFISERNRPDEYGGNEGSGFLSADNAEARVEEARERMASMMPASHIGAMVRHAVEENIFYIVSHDSFRGDVNKTNAEINDAFDYWQKFQETLD